MHIFRLGLCTVVLVASLLAGAQQIDNEYQVKAAYLYDFAKLGHWPAKKLPDESVLVIGVFGGNEDFAKVLRDTLAGKKVNGHPLEIRHLQSPDELKFCHLVFFRESERTTGSALDQLGRSSVLLVGENKNFLRDGGMIIFAVEDGKIAYAVNSAAIENSSLQYGDMNSPNTKPANDTSGVQPEGPRSIRFRVLPEYPAIAAAMKLNGAVQLEAVVRPDGRVKQIRVLGGHPILGDAAGRAVMQWRYQPAKGKH
jgi:TonB family protein